MNFFNVLERFKSSHTKELCEKYETVLVDLVVNESFLIYRDMTLFHNDVFRGGVGYTKILEADPTIIFHDTIAEQDITCTSIEEEIKIVDFIFDTLLHIRQGIDIDIFLSIHKKNNALIGVEVKGNIYKLMWKERISWGTK